MLLSGFQRPRFPFVFAGSLLLLTLTLSGCKDRAETPVIASINGADLYRVDFDRFLDSKMGEFTSLESSDSLKSQMLDEYIQRRIVLAEALKAGLAVTDTEIDQAAQENPQARSAASAPTPAKNSSRIYW